MNAPIIAVVYVVVMIAAIVGLDVSIFRHHLWERLMVNIGVVLLFVAFYLRFFGHPWAPGR
jgi:protein-S-isoprenylcysteine O-methyltransferase Ste14